jgi:Putative MetA-pathway of phenol degradation
MTSKFPRTSVVNTLGCAASLTALTFSQQAEAASNPAANDPMTGFDLRGDEAFDDGRQPMKASRNNSADIATQVEMMRNEMAEQRDMIRQQNEIIARQQLAIDMLLRRSTGDTDLAELRGTGMGGGGMGQGISPASQETTQTLPDTPVGEAPPPEPTIETKVEAVPEGQGVLTPAGRLVIDPSFDYTSSSTNRLVFRGIELVPGIQIGLIEASDADRDTIVTTMGLRYGVTNRLEAELRVPALYRWDRIEVAQQRDEGIVRTIRLKERDIGDVEFALRYQLNRPRRQSPIWVANLRVKSDTGKSPFEVGYDEFGVATGLATGSGFWAVQPAVNFLLPSDPAVIFGSLGYLWHIPRDIDRNVGGALIGRVDPGDAISGNIGFGFALNPRFSFSLGYRHSYIFPTTTEIGPSIERSNRAQVGSFNFGMSYRLSPRQSVNIAVEMGATADAPDLGVTLRFPLSVGLGKKR